MPVHLNPPNAARPYDAVIVGARCAGAATALLLARRGLRVLVVDRARRGSDTLSTHALMRPAVVQLHRWGLLDALVAARTPPIRRTIFHYGADRVAVTLRPAAGTDALYAPRRTVLDSVLLDAAEQAGADVLTGVTVRDLIRQAGRVAGVVLDNGSGGQGLVRAGLTIGADGVRSLIAARAGASMEQQGRHAAALVYGYFDGLPSDGYEWFYGRGATAGLIPTNDHQTVLFVARPAQRRGNPIGPGIAGVHAVLADSWPEGRERLQGAHLVSRLRQWRGTAGYRRTASGPGWALIGDAGYFKDPMSTHGISQALRDAELLADALTRASGQTQKQTLRAYQRQRDAVSAPMFDAVERIASFAWDLTEVRNLLMTVSSAISDEVELVAGLDAARAAPQTLSA
jgi:2-polyprenyl-6-methoxyphenol hydroxylase-like FAD-dependent oxidoreductase